LFEDLHGFESGKALSKHIVATATTRFYGTAGRAFLAAIMPQLDDIRRQATEVTAAFCEAYLPKGADGQVGRVAQRFALIAFAGELAIRLGVIKVWAPGTAIAAAGICFEAWLKERGHQGAAEVHGGIEAVRSFLQMNGMARFVDAWGEEELAAEHERWVKIAEEAGTRPPAPLRSPIPQRDACGFRRKISAKGGWEFYINDAGWAEISAGFNPKTLAKTMIEAKALLPDPQGNRNKRLIRVPGYGRHRCYHIMASFLDCE
jgi:putative DNA primase/helicase